MGKTTFRVKPQLGTFIASRDKELSKFVSKTALQIYHQNIQGLRCKVDEILNFLYPDFPQVICVSEHHLQQAELDILHLGIYTLGASYCRQSIKMGGVCIFVHQDVSFTKIDLGKFCIDQHMEACAILLYIQTTKSTYYYEFMELTLAILLFS
jgi:hypothetical protein